MSFSASVKTTGIDHIAILADSNDNWRRCRHGRQILYFVQTFNFQVDGKSLEGYHLQALSEYIYNQKLYEKLGTELGIEQHKLDSILTSNKPEITIAAHVMLKTWYMNQDNSLQAMDKLVDVLKRAELKLFINLVLRK